MMFIKNSSNETNRVDGDLVFVKSKNIQVFPCGRRRSNLIDADNSSTTISDRYYIPFDPEARLNTEANNRKHSGLNGFKASYIKSWDFSVENGTLCLVIDGYLFEITLDQGYQDDARCGEALAELLGASNEIYANIKLADIKFFDGMPGMGEVTTEVLRDQVLNDEPAVCLDFLISDSAKTYDKTDPSSYYFSGLSFSAKKLEDKQGETYTGVKSLQILSKDDSGWHIYNPAKLPKIDHGDTKDSVKLNDLYANKIEAAGSIEANYVNAKESLTYRSHPVAMFDVVKLDDKDCYQLKFYSTIAKN